jgi:hypothetical protein
MRNIPTRRAAAPDDRPTAELALRIPGRWAGPSAVAAALPDGYVLRHGRLVLPDESSVELRSLPPDEAFPTIFACACRGTLDGRTRRSLEEYTANVCLLGPGGSIDAVRRMLTAGAALLRARGLGVFVDTAVLAHERQDWLDMAASDDVYAALAAFVNVLRKDGELFSLGMHAFGERDATVSVAGTDGEAIAGDLLHHFLGYLLISDGAMTDGAVFGTLSGEAVVRAAPPATIAATTSPAYNARGRWRLEPLGTS